MQTDEETYNNKGDVWGVVSDDDFDPQKISATLDDDLLDDEEDDEEDEALTDDDED